MPRSQSPDRDEVYFRSNPPRRRTERSERTAFDRFDATGSRDRNLYSRRSLAVPSIHVRASSADERREAPYEIRRTRSNGGSKEVRFKKDRLQLVKDKVSICLDSLQELEDICRDKDEATKARPDQLTFTKIADQTEDHYFRLKVWANETELGRATEILPDGADLIKNVQSSISLLEDTTRDLIDLCTDAHYSDLAERYSRDENEDSVASQIKENLLSNESLIGNMSLLSEPLAEVLEVPVKKERRKIVQQTLHDNSDDRSRHRKESKALTEIEYQPEVMKEGPKQALCDDTVIQDIVTYFGSENRLRKYPVRPEYSGSRSLSMARELYDPPERRHALPQPKSPEYRSKIEPKVERVESFPTYRTPLYARTPVYARISRQYLDIRTLEYYDLKWEYDPNDPEYIIVLEVLDQEGIEILFEHTKRLRSNLMADRSKYIISERSDILLRESSPPPKSVSRERSRSYRRAESPPPFKLNIS